MKLYTEEQVDKIALQVYNYGYWDNRELTPIELPSDEDIEKGVTCSNLGLRYDYSMSTGFKKGAKWMRDIIQGGSHE